MSLHYLYTILLHYTRESPLHNNSNFLHSNKNLSLRFYQNVNAVALRVPRISIDFFLKICYNIDKS